jgi:translation initiation factor 2 alpha subunit (eIF-2alpha)
MRRTRVSSRARQSADAETLVKMARRLSESGSRLEDQLWQRRLIELINDRLDRRNDDAIETALDDLARTSQRAYDDLADLAESCAETTTIEIDDSGLVKIAAFSKEEAESALQLVKQITSDPEVGAIYEGTVVKITDFGAFVNIMPGTDGLVHISQLASHRVTKVSDVVKEGEKLRVKVLEVGRDGKIRLSHKALLEEEHGRSPR